MEVSDVLAATALVVSIFSAWLSYTAHRQSTRMSEGASRRGFARERSAFLVRIEKSRKLYERTQHLIKSLLARIETLPEVVGTSLSKEVAQLRADESYLEGCLRQSWSLWDETYEASEDGFAFHKPRHLGLIEDDDAFAENAMARAKDAENSMNLALSIHQPVFG